ncbi:alpha/beta hydrolase [Luteimonas sp. RD2P54]|uniref:Alpha/beta hydrolase n=1 Tax=Luteimonas endophytica TaxID=3042023 RepID=A0ABT6J6F9_9GAMM|nr:alpha/beta hydrolase [Luteimonas endophytica]MDH5822420.1 alpha/beta hydrolase [Luteimonas endophytica]
MALALALCLPPVAAGAQGWAPGAETAQERASRIALWPARSAAAGAGAGTAGVPAQRIVERSADPRVPDRFIEHVRDPYLAVYAPACGSDGGRQRPPCGHGTALLVIPGGGYVRVVLDKEGTALVPDFVDTAGITLFVLRYRLPGDGHLEGADAPLADAQRALRIIRERAAALGLDPQRVGVMGFSAGGHVAARLATARTAAYAPVDGIDRRSARPDFALLVYPVISMAPDVAHAGSRREILDASAGNGDVRARERRYSPDLHVGPDTPPLFVLHAQDDDAVPVANSLAIHAAALRAEVPASLHVFPRGGHGFGTRAAHGALAAWPRLAIDWIQEQARP